MSTTGEILSLDDWKNAKHGDQIRVGGVLYVFDAILSERNDQAVVRVVPGVYKARAPNFIPVDLASNPKNKSSTPPFWANNWRKP